MARRVARSSARRGATPKLEPRIRNEVGAIAVVAFALLSAVALATDQGALLQWWRASLFGVLGWGAILVPLVLATAALELCSASFAATPPSRSSAARSSFSRFSA